MDDGNHRVEVRLECLKAAIGILSLKQSANSNLEEGPPATLSEILVAANKLFNWVEE